MSRFLTFGEQCIVQAVAMRVRLLSVESIGLFLEVYGAIRVRVHFNMSD